MSIRSGMAKKALVIGAETLTRMLDWDDRTTAVLFGDGAGAVVLEASEEAGILSTQLVHDQFIQNFSTRRSSLTAADRVKVVHRPTEVRP